jgi:hypothetical protein
VSEGSWNFRNTINIQVAELVELEEVNLESVVVLKVVYDVY